MIALGVDSGSISTGYGVVESLGQRYRALSFGAIRNTSDTPQPERLLKIIGALKGVVGEFHPSILALEDVFISKNPMSALKLGQIRGAVMVMGMQEGLEIREFSATRVKSAVTGYGRAGKEQVQAMVKAMLGLPKPPQPHDAADALAIAICAITAEGWSSKVAQR